MSNIAIQGAVTGTGVFTLASPATNTNRTLTLPDEAGTVLTSAGVPASAMPAGSVIQVVSATKSDTQSTSLQAWVDVTGLSVSITPTSASSEILVIVNVQGSGTDRYNGIRVVRNGNAVGVGDTEGSRTSILSSFGLEPDSGTSYVYVLYNASGSFLDNPASTSSQTYKVQFGSTISATAAYINRTQYDGDAAWGHRGISTITVMEVAG